jgi:hypothetical protein
MWRGTLVAESLRVGSTLDGVPFTIERAERIAPGDLSRQQLEAGIPERWTLLRFTVADADAQRLADALAEALDGFGWYADLGSDEETIVVFSGRVFRYARGDRDERAVAEEHGRAHGVPDEQLDWP